MPEVGQERELVVAVEVGDLGLERRADRTTGAPSFAACALDRREQRIVPEAVLVDVGDVHRRLHREQAERSQHVASPRRRGPPARRPPCVEHRHRPSPAPRRSAALPCRRPRAPSCAYFSELLLDGREVRERELGVDRLDVGQRIDLARHVDDVVVLEAAHDVRDRVGLADVGEELVAEAFALRRAGDEPRDVDELDRRRDDLLAASRSPRAPRGAGRAPRRCRRWARSCRTDSSRPRCRPW